MGIFSLFSSKDKDKSKIEEAIKVDFSNFKRVTDYIYEKSGITDLDTRALTASRLQNYAKEQNIYTTNNFLESMQNSALFYQEIMNIATINESFFFREKKELDWLVSYIKNSTKQLDILVLPCSTGEEVYSILLLLLEEDISIDRVNISGCDINSQAIRSAKMAEYDEHSLHNIDSEILLKYFVKNEKNLYKILPLLRRKPNFYQENIFEIDTTKKYDIVLSRNMFIYFDDENRKKALQVIVDLLRPNGIYIKGHADYIQKHRDLSNLAYGVYSKQI